MNTNKLKAFAKTARIILREAVKQRVSYWGFDAKGNVKEEVTAIEGGYMFRENVFNDPSIPKKWNALKSAIKRHSVDDIIEEAAYTWFNRLIAIKILEKNNYIDCVYEYVSSELKEPSILMKARKGDLGLLKEVEKKLLNQYILDSNDEEAFVLLLISYCRNQKLLNRIFGHIDDYTELLLPNNLLSGGGIIEHINLTDFIEDKDFGEVELIGWLYQFYISDKKDEVFAGFKNKKKARPEDIPAATQIFTPKWIVKYMVENTVGRVWLDSHPGSDIKKSLKYWVEPAEKEGYEPKTIINSVIELTLLDPACGSGHILVEGFDVLLKMYLEEGYTTKNAVESILKNNLFGLDIDDRAAQLANFALLLKAAKHYPEILKTNILPNIYSFPDARDFSIADINLFLGPDGIIYGEKLKQIIDLLQQGKNLGSTIKLEMSKEMLEYIKKIYWHFEEKYLANELDLAEAGYWIPFRTFIQAAILLSQKYSSVVANPPYMGQKNMNESLKEYVNKEYPISKSDLFAVFMEVCWNCLFAKSYMGMINQHSWMFLSSFENMRDILLNNYQIESMLHLGPRAFEEVGGEVVQSTTFVLKNEINNGVGVYYRLVDGAGDEKKQSFLAGNNIHKSILQSEFSKIPGSPIAYWVSEKERNMYFKGNLLSSFSSPRKGIDTGENERFLRFWSEVSLKKASLYSLDISKKWFPYNKGGEYRKWYGNREHVVNWEKDGFEIKKRITWARQKPTIRNKQHFYQEGFTWTTVSSSGFSCRYIPSGCLFDNGGCTLFAQKDLYYIGGLLNSNVVKRYLEFISPTLNFQPGDIGRVLYYEVQEKEKINELTKNCILKAKQDWDSRETSWDFKINELLRFNRTNWLQSAFDSYCNYWQDQFYKLHKDEEELNRIFINIYDLQEELTPNVMLKDITILQDETYISENAELAFKKAEILKQFISYVVGCIFGRFSLDKEGFILANQGDTLEEFRRQIPNPRFIPDEDGIIPFIGGLSNFSDDVHIQFKQFLEIAFSPDLLTENINFIQECLDMDLEKFLTERFWQYHCKMYQKKPIYWMFSSPKGAFKILVYLHRMNKFTVQKIRNNYLLKHLSYLRSEIVRLENDESRLSRQDAKLLDKFRSDEIECREYDKLVKDYADKQIELDLDDGVSVNYKKFDGILATIK